MEQETILRDLSKLENEKEDEITRLQSAILEMQECYEEMRNTKRLKELLSNMRMAEEVRENWAARRIQVRINL